MIIILFKKSYIQALKITNPFDIFPNILYIYYHIFRNYHWFLYIKIQ
jgi:hypothetical protein